MLDERWYSETWPEGAAISLKLKAKLYEEQSPYQHIEIYDTEGFGRLMTLDGLVMVTDRDNFMRSEDAVSYGLIDRVLASRTELATPTK